MNKILLILFIIFISTVSFSQSYPPPETDAPAGKITAYTLSEPPNESRFFRRIILGGGLVNAGYEGSDINRYSRPNAFNAGFALDIIGTRKLVFEVGAQYRQLATNFEGLTAPNSSSAVTAEYITVPMSAKYYFNGQELTSLYVKGGVQGSTLLSNNKIYSAQNVQIGPRLWETALLAGLGVKLNLSPYSDLVIEAAYNRSVDPIFENSSVFRSDLSANAAVALTL